MRRGHQERERRRSYHPSKKLGEGGEGGRRGEEGGKYQKMIIP
jgi:hypothetical protein